MASLDDVTIIIPVYIKTEEYLPWLKECLDSAFQQGCKVAIYDDGSPIDIKPLVNSYQKASDVFTKMQGKVNRGVAAARNIIINRIDTKLILPLDCDDKLKPNAVSTLLQMWNENEIPVYPDVAKFGLETEPHYALLDFNMDNIYKYVGFASVNVLHSKEQCKAIGGYDESLEFYEDGDYNARLFCNFCGVRCPLPLVDYRIHENQRTKLYQKRAAEFAAKIQAKIRRLNMPCQGCGGGRRTTSNFGAKDNFGKDAPSVAQLRAQEVIEEVHVDEMPLERDGMVLAHYIGGKGRGSHYYQGRVTKQVHKVKYDTYTYVDVRDTKYPDDMASQSFFVRVVRASPRVTTATPAPVIPGVTAQTGNVTAGAAPTTTVRKPVAPPKPVAPVAVVEVQAAAPTKYDSIAGLDIRHMTFKKIADLALSQKDTRKLLADEKGGLNRSKVVQYLEDLLNAK